MQAERETMVRQHQSDVAALQEEHDMQLLALNTDWDAESAKALREVPTARPRPPDGRLV
jgi:hypothetical protein